MTMRTFSAAASLLALVLADLPMAGPAQAQTAEPMARPAPIPGEMTRPAPTSQPTRPPGGGWGGSGGSSGGNNGGGWGGSGGNNGGGWGGSGGGGGNWNGETIRCESRDGRYRACQADTRGGVRLVRQLSSTPCREGRSWGRRSNEIWVDDGCRGEFELRYGSGNSGGGGPSAGAVIGGVAIAGGLLALLSQANKKPAPAPIPEAGAVPPLTQPPAIQPPAPPAGPARITAQMGGVTPDARPSLSVCLAEAARQVGATGGTEVILDRLDDIEAGNGGFRFRFQLKAVYPDETRTIPTFCRATPTKLVELTFS
ncbi:MAG: DUF3011 domain-containing protein [Polymorphobacter sp.]